MKRTFTRESFLSVPPSKVFSFHERSDAFELLTPPGFGIEVLSTATTLAPNEESEERVRFLARFLLFKFRFGMVHTVYEPPHRFADEQREGLFSFWRHQHRFLEGGWQEEPATLLSDTIEYGHPLLPLFDPFVRHRLHKLFAHRHWVTRRELSGTARTSPLAGQRIVITGATGLIGGRITEILVEQGVRVVALVRDPERARKTLGDRVELARWDFTRPEDGDWRGQIDGADAVVHLAGTPLFEKRWTAEFKRQMTDSRVLSTRQLVEAIAASKKQKPSSFVSASALGIYGTDLARSVDESTPAADDLLARICVDWEAEARKVQEAGVRTVQIRIGIVLSRHSGAIKEMLPPFLGGLGGVLGDPQPFINWIHLEDVARIFVMALANPRMQGPYNAAAPNPVSNRQLARTLARVLRRPCLLRYPVPAVKLIIGEAGEYASGGPRALSDKITGEGYRFFFTELEPALRNTLHHQAQGYHFSATTCKKPA